MARQQAIAARFEGISDLRARGVHVFMTREEWEGESVREMKAWNEKDLKSLLERGPAFRTIPAPLSREERETTLNRAQRKGLAERRGETKRTGRHRGVGDGND